jgi:hypothetical protein
MCSVCDFDNNFVDRFGVRCGTCAQNEGRNALLVAVGAFVGCLLLVLKHMQNKRQEKGKTTETRTWVDLPARLRKELKIRSMKLRVLLSFVQVCVRLQVAFRLQFPPLVVSFLSFLSFFDFGRFIKLVASSKCLIHANAVTQLYFQCYGTLALLVGLAVAGAVAEFTGTNKKQNVFFDLALILSFLAYPSVTSSLLLSFDCKRFEDNKIYMIGDPSVLCTDPDYELGRSVVAYPMLGILVLGIPLA